MLAIAREKLQNYPNVSFKVANASKLPFANNSFDIIISANAFHYFEDPDVALKEMKRVLKPEGQVIILDWCKDYLFCRIFDFFFKIFDPAYQKSYTQAQFHRLLVKAKFKIRLATKIRFGWIWGLMAIRATPE
jgi:ubiquinone/menaquinone biosynthesis C-methylase UbiE